jgi:SAM-dependent methyltransferase
MAVDWSAGYVTDIEYTYGYYPELSPVLLNYVAVMGGHRPRPIDREFTYCELGCGNGVSTNVMAACYSHGKFYGVDFNPNHIANAAEIAAAGKLDNVQFLERDFRDLPSEEIPDFDFIALHGVYSWVSAENRRAIVDFIRAKLKPGGIVYVSYNALPGWATIEPLRRLLVEFSTAARGDTAAKINATLDHISQLAENEARFFDQGGRVKAMLDRLKQASANYVAHEYLNKDWTLFYFTDVAREMAGAKLTFAGSANTVKNHLHLAVPQHQHKLLSAIEDPLLRELEKDYLTNEQFRRDVYVKALPGAGAPSLATLAQLKVGSVLEDADIKREIRIPAGTMRLQHPFHEKLIALVAEAPRTIAELIEHPDLKDQNATEIAQVVASLIAGGQFRPFAQLAPASRGTSEIGGRFTISSAFNRAVLASLFGNSKVRVLASPVAGAGIAIGTLEGFILAGICAAGMERAVDWAWQQLVLRNRRLVKEGKPIESEAENKKLLTEELQQFQQAKLQRYRLLGVVELQGDARRGEGKAQHRNAELPEISQSGNRPAQTEDTAS